MLQVFSNNKKLRFVFLLLILVNYVRADSFYREETYQKISKTYQDVFVKSCFYVKDDVDSKIQSIHSFININSDIDFLNKALKEIEAFFKDYNEGMDDFGVHVFTEKEVDFFCRIRLFLKKEIKRISKITDDGWVELVTIKDSSGE